MFDTLDTIDWAAFGPHIYGQAAEIPGHIRRLLSPHPVEREEALALLFGEGQDYGNVYGTTAPIIPFVLEVIADDTLPGREACLDHLEWITIAKVYTGGQPEYSIRQMRHYLNAYDALERGIPLYFKLLDDPQANIRSGAAAVLAGLNASAATILPVLHDHFTAESIESVQIALIEAMARLLREQDYSGSDLRKTYAPFFHHIVDTGTALRFTAAKAAITASVSQGFGTQLERSEVTPGLVAALLERYWSLPDDFDRAFARQEIVRLLAHLPDLTPLIDLLHHPATTPEDAHLLGRGLLASTVHGPVALNQYWNYYPIFKYRHEKKIYDIYNLSQTLDIWRTLSGGIWDVLQALVDADQFWVLPTNLLSVMFNLPDDREHLRAFVERKGMP